MSKFREESKDYCDSTATGLKNEATESMRSGGGTCLRSWLPWEKRRSFGLKARANWRRVKQTV